MIRNKLGQFVKGRHYSSSTEFKKGIVPWNKDKYVRHSPTTEFTKGHLPWNTGKKRPEISGEFHPNWKGGISNDIEHLKELHRKATRMRKLRKRNAEGSHTLEEWEKLKQLYKYMCLCCKKTEPEIKLTRDHIAPLTKGGTDYLWNIQPLCISCNSIKKMKTVDYRELL